MGVNILLYKKTTTGKKYDGYGMQEHIEYESKKIEGWDTMRYSFDREFCSEDEIEWEFLEGDEYCSRRPKDINQIKKRLDDKPDFVKERYEFMIQKLEEDKNIYVEFNW